MKALAILLLSSPPLMVHGQTAGIFLGHNPAKYEVVTDSLDLEKGKKDISDMKSLYIQGLKKIRHDALVKWKFKYAHTINLKIKQKSKP